MIEQAIPLNILYFIEYLNNHYSTLETCTIIFLPFHATVETDDDDADGEPKTAFAMYSSKRKAMYVAGYTIEYFKEDENPELEAEKMLMENIAHEYIHHKQYCRGEEFNENTIDALEEEAETLAISIVEEYLEWRSKNA